MAIESCLDIAGHIVSYQGYRQPSDNQDIFQVLIEEKILDSELGNQLKKRAKFRNIIVHDYVKLDPEIVFGILTSEIKDIKKFFNVIKDEYIN
ncbi:type VII toxin-antitoxin system HepT family RNase toxin [Natranaerofaba carboxydovora]|uniref:type VII toxin-antitoxin system HepT family RNase toxin n=1 Tax=Natranaerofaba carboxydovora TaxID=2742683 RepID=UPI001F13E32D|nr:HepT-like ribonuclease domain-containing protein [Natranaerofaba carboxydovora]UMZ74971.1 hypothetical protein ACONDI_02577 [Natranaerofaba carboxydovora]